VCLQLFYRNHESLLVRIQNSEAAIPHAAQSLYINFKAQRQADH